VLSKFAASASASASEIEIGMGDMKSASGQLAIGF
jgi:hypothetical protein